MKRILLLLVAIVPFTIVSAQQTLSFEGADETVFLWDNSTAKFSNYETRDEAWRKKNSIKQTSSCEIYIFKAAPEKNTGIAIAMYPGGGYSNLNFSAGTARWYASLGITAVLVKYRLPNYGHYEATLEDAVGVVNYLRTRTDLGIDPAKIGVSGSSAGGHLAAWTSNAMSDDQKPAFAILHFPWINVAESLTSTESKALPRLLGKNFCYQTALDLSPNNLVSPTTPPTLLLLCDDDATVPSISSSAYYKMLLRYGVKASMHIYPKGGHSLKLHIKEMKAATIDWLTYLNLIE